MVEKLAIQGGKRTVPEGLVKPWPMITDEDTKAILKVLDRAEHSDNLVGSGVLWGFGPEMLALDRSTDLIDDSTGVQGIWPPNDIELMELYVEAFRKVFGNLDPALELAGKSAEPSILDPAWSGLPTKEESSVPISYFISLSSGKQKNGSSCLRGS